MKLFKENNARIRFLSDEEETRLFSVLPEKYKPLVTVAIHTGLRTTEQLSLKWTDTDFKLGQITVRESKPGKSRVIPMNETVEAVLNRVSRDGFAIRSCSLAGHQDVRMTMRYAHLAPGYMKAAVNILSKRGKRTGTRTGTE